MREKIEIFKPIYANYTYSQAKHSWFPPLDSNPSFLERLFLGSKMADGQLTYMSVDSVLNSCGNKLSTDNMFSTSIV